MKKLALIITAILLSIHAIHGQYTYDIDNIADSLKKNADAIIRIYTISYERSSLERYTVDVHYAVTILNENGKSESELVIFYDRNAKVSDIKGSLYNKKGVLQAKLKKKEIRDYAANSNYTLFSDNRVKYFKPAVSNYPYTIEYLYTIENKGIVGFDTWIPQKGFNISVEKAKLTFNISNELGIKYKELNHTFVNDVTVLDGKKSYEWTVYNLKAIEYEPYIPNYLDFMPALLLSPNKIKYENTKGDLSSWKSYGKWIYELISNRDELPEETVIYIKNLTDTIPDKKEKAKAIYKYMQSKTRYVNIAMGIGGFQPILAADVDEKGYGDCKALSNYTKALLKCAGIESYYAEIGTGKHQEIKFTDFASANQTNHVILCVPFDSDTVWLECTNQQIPFGYIGPGNQNRYALLIKPNGGELVKTPFFNANQNTRISNIKLSINELGYTNFRIKTEYNYDLYSEIFTLLNNSEKEQKETLLNNLSSTKSIGIDSFSVKDKSDTNAKGELCVKGILNNYASIAGTRMLFVPMFFHKNKFANFIPSERKLDIYEPIDYTYIDTLQINLPKKYIIEHLQKSQHFSSVFGNYSFDIEQTGEGIIIVRKLSINKGRYNYEIFDEINEFLREIHKIENKKIIITNKQQKMPAGNI